MKSLNKAEAAISCLNLVDVSGKSLEIITHIIFKATFVYLGTSFCDQRYTVGIASRYLDKHLSKDFGNGQTGGRMRMSVYLGDMKHYYLNNKSDTVAVTDLLSSVYLSDPCHYYRILLKY